MNENVLHRILEWIQHVSCMLESPKATEARYAIESFIHKELRCRLEWKDNFYSEDILKSLDYGCYNPNSFPMVVVAGVRGSYVQEGCCPIHGVIISKLGGILRQDVKRHPCGAAYEIS